MPRFSKHLAVAKITDPTDVQAECASRGWTADKGAIFCHIPEIGFEGTNLVYCRYGLSVPYIRIKEEWKVWIEPTINNDERWIYTGIADCGQDSGITPTTNDVGLIVLPAGKYTLTINNLSIIIDSVAGTIKLGSSSAAEAYILGNTLKTELQKIVDALTQLNSDFTTWVVVPNDGGGALKTKVMAGFTTKAQAVLTNILSTKIKGE